MLCISDLAKEWAHVHSFIIVMAVFGKVVCDLKKADIEQRCEALVTPIIDENHFELVDVEYVKEGADYYLRVYADKEGGITIDDCVLISRALEQKLDEEDLIPDAYILEVSSPGLGRPLKKDKDFKRSIGREVDLKLYQAMDGEKEFTGTLKAYDAETVTIETAAGEKQFARNKLALIRLALDF